MPLIGSVPVAGHDPASVERAIAARLRSGFIRDPRVSVEVEAFRPFFVLGEVTTAGQYPYVEGMTAQMAIAIAGGFNPRAYQSAVDMTRNVNGRPVTGRVPLDALLQPGDTITVREERRRCALSPSAISSGSILQRTPKRKAAHVLAVLRWRKSPRTARRRKPTLPSSLPGSFAPWNLDC
jgi:protein involved in polysaccharide export with SLBB domain